MRRDNGVLTIYETDDTIMESDPNAPGTPSGIAQHTHQRGSGLEYEIEAERFAPGRVISASGMSVYIKPFRYNWTGTWKTWPGGMLNLSPYKTVTTGEWSWILVGVEPTSNVATAAAGPSVPEATALNVADLDSIVFGNNMPLVAIKVKASDTTLADWTRYYSAAGWFNQNSGPTGATGPAGGDSVEYVFVDPVDDADPGISAIRFNNEVFASITQLYIDDQNLGADDIQAWLAVLDDSTGTVKGSIRVFKKSNNLVFATFQVTAITEAVGYWKIDVTPVASGGAGVWFVDGDVVVVTWARAGDLGTTGATGEQGIQGIQGEPGTPGAATFLALTDTPAAYTGSGGKVVIVNVGEAALEFAAPISTFLGLTDTPASYAGAGNYYVKVNAGANALEFVAAGGAVAGSGTINYVPLWTAADTLGDSIITQVDSKIGIGVAVPGDKLDIAGRIRISSDSTFPGTNIASIYRSASTGLSFTGKTASTYAFYFANDTGNDVMFNPVGTTVMSFTGNVGIGEASPGYGKLSIADAFADTLTFNRTPEIGLKNTNATNGNYAAINNFNSAGAVNSGIDFINVDHGYKGAVSISTRTSAGVYGRHFYVNEDGKIIIGSGAALGTKVSIYDSVNTSLMYLIQETAATYTDASPSAQINLRSRWTGQVVNWDTARLKWGFADTYSSNGARFGIDILDSAGNWKTALTVLGSGAIVIPASPAIYLTGTGTGAYDKTVIYNDATIGLYFDVARETDAAGGTPRPFTIAPRGGNPTWMKIESGGDVGFGTDNPDYDLHVVRNQNASTVIGIGNSTNAGSAACAFNAYCDVGGIGVGKFASGANAYKTILAGAGYLYNHTNGNLAVLNDYSSGHITFAAGGHSEPDLTLYFGGGTIIYGQEATDAELYMYADNGDDVADCWKIRASTNGNMYFENFADSTWEAKMALTPGGIAYFYDNVYAVSNVSAASFTDRTDFFDGDAVAELIKIKAEKGSKKLDHTSLPKFAQAENGERNLGNMVSMLTVAVQQLNDRLSKLEAM
jgi:hypothetical protein